MDVRARPRSLWWIVGIVACTPASPEAPPPDPTAVQAKVQEPLSSCAGLPGGRDAVPGACGTSTGLRGCEQTPTHPALRGRGLVLTRCFTADWKDDGQRTLTRDDALVLMGADPDPDKVVCFFFSLKEWASFPAAAIDAAYAWAGCTERTMRDPFVDG